MHGNISDVEIVHMQVIIIHSFAIGIHFVISLKLRLCNLQLYKLKFKLESHIVETWFARVFFFAIDNIHVDVENLQMLQCIICRKK